MKISLLHTILSFVLLWLLSLLLFNLSFLNPIEKAFQDFSYSDLYYSKKLFKEEKVNTDIVLINIKKSDRATFGFIITQIARQQPAVIGLDVIFKERKDIFQDSILAKSLIAHQDLLVGSKIIEPDHSVKNATPFSLKNTGFINLNLAEVEDRVIRNFTPTYEDVPSFDVAIVNHYNPSLLKDIDLKRTMPINYVGNYNHFITLNSEALMTQDSIPLLKGKIVLLGYLGTPTGSMYDIEDKHFTPLNKNHTGKSIPDMFGITIHANIINMLLKKDFINVVPSFIVYGTAFLLTFLSSLLFVWVSNKDYPWLGVAIKIYQLLFTILFLWFALFLLSKDIKFPVLIVVASVLLSLEFLPYLVYVSNRFQKKYL